MKPLISVIMVSFNTAAVTCRALQSIEQALTRIPHEIIVVDNASRDDSVECILSRFPQVKLLCSDVNLGFGAANNKGMRAAEGEYFALVNSDAFVAPDALQRALAHMVSQPQVALGGARLTGRDGDWQPSARRFPRLRYDFFILSGLSARFPRSRIFGEPDRSWSDPLQPCLTDWVPGAFAVIRRSALEKTGLFDERFFLYYEEVDLCLRLKQAGWQIAYWPDIHVVHLGGESSRTLSRLELSPSGQQLTLWRMRSALLYYRKHHGMRGALTMGLLEGGWHLARWLRNLLRPGERAIDHARHARQQIRLLFRAWQDTSGGRLAPPRPW